MIITTGKTVRTKNTEVGAHSGKVEWLHETQQAEGCDSPLGVAVLLRGEPSEPYVFEDGTTSYRVTKRVAGRMLDGRTWDEFPEVTK